MPSTTLTAILAAAVLAAAGCASGDDSESVVYEPVNTYTQDPVVPDPEPQDPVVPDPQPEDPVEPDPDPEPSGTESLNLFVQRYTPGLSPSTSIECYTFRDDGSVELRHNGAGDVTDYGTWYGDDSDGEIQWESGRTSAVTYNGSSYYINSAEASEVDYCS